MRTRESFRARARGPFRAKSRKLHVKVFIVALLVWPFALHAQGASEESTKLVRAMAGQLRATAHLPGLSVAVAKGDQVIFAEGFGFADVERKRPVTTTTQFRTASVGKAITATALGKLVQEGRLNLDANVRDYVPAFPVKQWTITPRQLAGHLAGVPHYNASDKVEKRFYSSVSDGLSVFAAESLLFEPGTRYAYSTHGFTLLSAVIESASGTPFLEFMKQAVFTPLHMSSTGPNLIASPGPAMTTLYTIRNGVLVRLDDLEDPSYKWAGGGLVSTPTDLVHLAAGYSNGFLKPETVKMMFTSQRLANGTETGVGIAWRNSIDAFGNRVIEQAGSMEGTRTVIVMYPASGLAVAIMTNTDWSSLVEETAHMMAVPFLTPPAPRKQPSGVAAVAVTIHRANGATENKSGSLVLEHATGRLTLDPGTASEVTYSLIYLERSNNYALVRPDGIVALTLAIDGDHVSGKAIGYGSPRLTPPASDPPFFTFEGLLRK